MSDRVSVPNLDIEKNRGYMNPEPIGKVRGEICIPIIVELGSHSKKMQFSNGANTTWYGGDYSSVPNGNNCAYMFKLFVEATAAKLGTPQVIPRDPDPAYKRTIALLGQKMAHLGLTKEEQSYLADHTRPGLYVNYQDVEAIEKARADAEASKLARATRNRNAGGGGDLPTNQQATEEQQPSYYEETALVSTTNTLTFITPWRVPTVIAENPHYNSGISLPNFVRRPLPYAAPQRQAGGDGDDEDSSEAELLAPPPEEEEEDANQIPEAQQIIHEKPREKITYTLTCIASPNPQVRIYLARFLILDKSICLGSFITRLLTLQIPNVSFGKYGHHHGGSSLITPHHMALMNSGIEHPFFGMTAERYLSCCFTFLNRNPTMEEMKSAKSNWNITSISAPFNPLNVFTMQNSLAYISRVCNQKLWPQPTCLDWKMWRQPCNAGFTATYPQNHVTYIHDTTQVFWSHLDKIGLSETQLPNTNLAGDFVTDILTGGSFDSWVDPVPTSDGDVIIPLMAHADEEEDLQKQLDKSDFQRSFDIATCHKIVMDRKDAQKLSTVEYKTNNMFLHLASMADKIYKKINGECPSDSSIIHAQCKPYFKKYRKFWITKLDPAVARLYLEASDDDTDPSTFDNDVIKKTYEEHRYYWKEVIRRDNYQLYRKILAYDRYCKLVRLTQKSMMEKFAPLWKMAGEVKSLPIPDGIKAILTWGQTNIEKSGIVTRKLTLKDPTMDFFATSIVKHMYIFSQCAKVLQPLICIMTEGAMSCHDHAPFEIGYNLGGFGRFDLGKLPPALRKPKLPFLINTYRVNSAGKTYVMIKTTAEFTLIPGTTVQQTRETKASNDSGAHMEDCVLLKDEVPQWMVNPKEAEKNHDLVNMEKLKTTNKQLILNALNMGKNPIDGRAERSNDIIVTNHSTTTIFVTNAAKPVREALISRFHTIIIQDPGVSSTSKDFKVQENLKSDGRDHMHWNHFHCAAAKKAAMVGAICREVDLSLFNDVTAKIRSFLEKKGVIQHGDGNRVVAIMKAFLVQMVYHNAVLHTYDIPGSPHYGKPWNISHVQDMQPYLYVTLQQILFVWTLIGTQLVDQMRATVLAAAVRACVSIPYQPEKGESTYSLLIRSTHPSQVPFKKVPAVNPNFVKGQSNDGDYWMTDLNYFVLMEETEEKIYARIARYSDTKSRLFITDIRGTFNELYGVNGVPPNGGYELVPSHSLRYQHCYVTEVDADGVSHQVKPNRDGRVYTEADIPRKPTSEQLPLAVKESVQFKSGRKVKLEFAPWAIPLYGHRVIVEAFEAATMTSSFPVQKMIIGRTMIDDINLLDVINYDATYIEEAVRVMVREESGQGNSDYSRENGISFFRGECMSDSQAQWLLGESLVHRDEGEAKQLKRYQAERERCRRPLEFVDNLEKWSATNQHLKAGYPLDAQVMYPKRLRKRYDKTPEAQAVLAENDANNTIVDYPISAIIEEREKSRLRNIVSSSHDTLATKNSHELVKLRQERDERQWLKIAAVPNQLRVSSNGSGSGGGSIPEESSDGTLVNLADEDSRSCFEMPKPKKPKRRRQIVVSHTISAPPQQQQQQQPQLVLYSSSSSQQQEHLELDRSLLDYEESLAHFE